MVISGTDSFTHSRGKRATGPRGIQMSIYGHMWHDLTHSLVFSCVFIFFSCVFMFLLIFRENAATDDVFRIGDETSHFLVFNVK